MSAELLDLKKIISENAIERFSDQSYEHKRAISLLNDKEFLAQAISTLQTKQKNVTNALAQVAINPDLYLKQDINELIKLLAGLIEYIKHENAKELYDLTQTKIWRILELAPTLFGPAFTKETIEPWLGILDTSMASDTLETTARLWRVTSYLIKLSEALEAILHSPQRFTKFYIAQLISNLHDIFGICATLHEVVKPPLIKLLESCFEHELHLLLSHQDLFNYLKTHTAGIIPTLVNNPAFRSTASELLTYCPERNEVLIMNVQGKIDAYKACKHESAKRFVD